MKRKTKAEKKAKRDREFASHATQRSARWSVNPTFRRADEDPLDIPPFLRISAERRKEAWKDYRRTK